MLKSSIGFFFLKNKFKWYGETHPVSSFNDVLTHHNVTEQNFYLPSTSPVNFNTDWLFTT